MLKTTDNWETWELKGQREHLSHFISNQSKRNSRRCLKPYTTNEERGMYKTTDRKAMEKNPYINNNSTGITIDVAHAPAHSMQRHGKKNGKHGICETVMSDLQKY
jgi:hypothetical protein